MFVSNHNGEVVSVVSRIKRQREGRVITVSIRDGVIVKLPSVGQLCTIVVVGNISSEDNRAVFANERVAADDNVRVRVDRQSVSVSADRFATSRCLTNCSREDVVGDVTINSQVADSEGRIGVTFHQLIVAVPSVEVRVFSNINTTVSMSSNRNLTTVANVIDRENDSVDNWNLVHIDLDGIV